jgi:Flp pilus assembly protein TadB
VAEGDEPAGDEPAVQPAAGESPDPLAVRPTSTEVLERAGAEPKPLNLNAEHQHRLNEAMVKQEETKADQAGDDRELRRWIAIGTSIAVAVQLIVADVVFVVYGVTNSWVIPGSTISAWLGATVVQVIALAVVIVRSLFPPKDK